MAVKGVSCMSSADWLIGLSVPRLCRGRLLVGTFVGLFFNLLTLLSVKNKPFVYVSEGKCAPRPCSRFHRHWKLSLWFSGADTGSAQV